MPDSNFFEVVDVTTWPLAGTETTGVDEKAWLVDPTGTRWLFKPVKRHVAAGTSWVQGEDWIEKVSAELASLLHMPCARVELAQRDDRPGCISQNLVPEGWELQHGAVLLSGVVPDYESGAPGRRGHSLANIFHVLAGCEPPPGNELPIGSNAFDVFAGYLLFDAWIANRDRHDENWSVLRDQGADRPLQIAPSYDHASGLGLSLLDDHRERLLRNGDVARWAKRGTAWRFEHVPGAPLPTLVDLACEALQLASETARTFWLTRLAALTSSDWVRPLERVPNLSGPSRTFAVELLSINQRRVLDACS